MRNNIKACFPLLASGMQDSLVAGTISNPNPEADHPEVRKFNDVVMQELRNDSAMDYHISSPDDNLWEMFRNWLFKQLVELFGNPGTANILEIILYVVAISAIIYAILRLLKVEVSWLIGPKQRKAILQSGEVESHEDIHEMDFGNALAEALKANEFHKAIRLLYLSSLKELTNREHISWQPGKTNYQYQQELKAAHLQSPFRQLGFFFEYAWYGNFQINEQHYREAERSYQSLQENLQPQA